MKRKCYNKSNKNKQLQVKKDTKCSCPGYKNVFICECDQKWQFVKLISMEINFH